MTDKISQAREGLDEIKKRMRLVSLGSNAMTVALELAQVVDTGVKLVEDFINDFVEVEDGEIHTCEGCGLKSDVEPTVQPRVTKEFDDQQRQIKHTWCADCARRTLTYGACMVCGKPAWALRTVAGETISWCKIHESLGLSRVSQQMAADRAAQEILLSEPAPSGINDPGEKLKCLVCLTSNPGHEVELFTAYEGAKPVPFCKKHRPTQADIKNVAEAAGKSSSALADLNARAMQKETDLHHFKDRVRELANRVTYRMNYRWLVNLDQENGTRVYFQLEHFRDDVNGGGRTWGKGGKRYLSSHMTDSEILRQMFAAAIAYEEHEVREWFKIDGKAVFGPHIDVNALATVAGELDIRS